MINIKLHNNLQDDKTSVSQSGTAGECIMYTCIGMVAILILAALMTVAGCV